MSMKKNCDLNQVFCKFVVPFQWAETALMIWSSCLNLIYAEIKVGVKIKA